ncbi:MAG: flagellar hook-associated protein FlgL [Acidimicrobiia bacterium]
MRVTNSMVVRSTLRDLNQSLSRLQATQSRISSGKELTKASDDPARAADAMGLRNDMRRMDQRLRTMEDSLGFLRTSDAALTSSLDVLDRAKEIAVRAGNTGALADGNARQAMATELRSIRDDLIAIGNSKHGDRFVFNGTAGTAAYASNGVYTGNTGSVNRQVGPTTTVTVNVVGTDIFGAQGGAVGDLFEVLDRMATAVLAGDGPAMATEHANLDAAAKRVGAAAVEIGSRAARLETLQGRALDDQMRLRSSLSQAEDVDLVEALVNVKAQETSYQAALQIAGRILPPTLLDFLR